jgi:hypothetical protein
VAIAGLRRPEKSRRVKLAGSIDSLGSRSLPFRIIRWMRLVDLIFTSWNPLTSWLRRMDALRAAAELESSAPSQLLNHFQSITCRNSQFAVSNFHSVTC